MERRKISAEDVDAVETAVREVLDNSDFQYLAVRLALEEIIRKYDDLSAKYAKYGFIKDITKYEDK